MIIIWMILSEFENILIIFLDKQATFNINNIIYLEKQLILIFT